MYFQKQINISANNTPYQYRTKEYFLPNSRVIYQGPKIYKEKIFYEYEPNSKIPNSAQETDYQLEINNEEKPTSQIYSIRREINSLNKKPQLSQLINERTYNSCLPNYRKNLREEIKQSPQTINIIDNKETFDHRSMNIRRSPDVRRIISKKNEIIHYNDFYEPEEIVEYRNGSFDRNRNYYNRKKIEYIEPEPEYIVMKSRGDSPGNYLERSGNKVLDRINDGFNASGIIPPYEEQMSPYNDETSNEFERISSDHKRTINQGENISNDYDYRQNRFENMSQFNNQGNNMQRIRNINGYNNYNNINKNQYQSQTMNLRTKRNDIDNIMNSTAMSFAPKKSYNKNIINFKSPYKRDDIKEKYQNMTYNNMTYKDVKKIVNKFTKVYDPTKNDKGILVENRQVIVPSAEDDVFTNRHRVLRKMRRLSNILLAKQNVNRELISKKPEEAFYYAINTNNRNNNINYNNTYYIDNDNDNNEINSDYDYAININKKSRTPIKYINHKAKNKNERFKYVSLAMLASKGVNTENRIILRKMRLEKGGVIDLAQMRQSRGKYKIRKVSRSPGHNKIYYRNNFKYRAKAAKKIQEWWRTLKLSMTRKKEKIILIQSVYRGRFVRKYLYDLLYLNYLYMSFCQKIEQALKKVIKPYIFYLLKNYGKVLPEEDIKNYDILRNIIASKEKKWKILNMRKGMDQLRKYLRKQEKITLAMYKLLKIKAEKSINKNAIMKNALRKWHYLTKIESNQKDKIKGLFNLLQGINIYAKKSALEPTIPKVINYLKEQKLKLLLGKLINKKITSDKEKLRNYFYKYIKNILQTVKIKPKPKNMISKAVYINILKKKKIQKYVKQNNEKLLIQGEEKSNDEIVKMKARLFLYLINSAKKKQDKNILSKYFSKYFKKIIQIQRDEDRRNFEERQKEDENREKEKEEEKLRHLRAMKLIPLPKIKENYIKNILKKYFDIWKKKTFNTKESSLKLFLKILDIIIDNHYKKLIRQKLSQWKKKKVPKKVEESIETEAEVKPEPEFDIFNTLKNLKDIINFNDYLRNIYVNKYGKEFLDKLDKTRNPKLLNKVLKKIVRKKMIIDKKDLRKVFNKWKNIAEFENVLNGLKAKLIYTIYSINKNNNQSNILKKYFNKWRNICNIENIRDEINNLRNSEKMMKLLLLKAILRNRDYNNKILLLKTYFNKWNSVLKNEKPKIDNLSQKIISLNISNNGPEFLDKLNTIKEINKRNELLLKGITNKNRADKMLLYKYLLIWRNKIKDFKFNDKFIKYRNNITNILLIKYDKQNLSKAFNKWRYNKPEKKPINIYLLGIKKIKKLFTKKPFNYFIDKMEKTNPDKLALKGKPMQKILNKLSKENPYNILINNLTMQIKENKLNDILPKVHEKMKKYYLSKYFNKWKNNAKELRLKNMQIITKWLKKQYELEKDKKLKRRNELLKRIFNNKIKSNKYQLKIPLYLWKRMASILTTNISAKIIQRFWRNILLKKQRNKRLNQNKLKNILINLYKKNIIRTISDPDQYDELNKYLSDKKEKEETLRNKMNNIDNNNNKILLRLALEKWKEKIIEINGKENDSATIIQTILRGKKTKEKIKRKLKIRKILTQIINRYDDNSKLNLYFIRWNRIIKKLTLNDNARIIQNFCRTIHDKYLRLLKEKNFPKYQNLSKILIRLGKNPKADFFDKFHDLFKNKMLEKLLNDLNDKRKDILGDAFDNIKYRNKLILLKDIFDNKDNRIKFLMKNILNKWKNKALNNKNILLFLTKFVKNKEIKDNNILRSVFYTWLYKAMFSKIKAKEKIISEFMKDIQKKKYIISKWKHLCELLKDQLKKDDINEIIDNLKDYKNIENLFNILKNHTKKNLFDSLKKKISLSIFQEKFGKICEDLEEKNNDNNIKKYFYIWKSKANKISIRLAKLEELMNLLDIKKTKDDAITLNQVMILKNLFNTIPRLYKKNSLNKIKDFADNQEKNRNFAKNLIQLEQEIKPKIVSPLLKSLYKVYAYKVLDELFNTINNNLKRGSEHDKKIFLSKMLIHFTNRYKDYKYSNQIEKEKKPYTKKILFKAKKNQKKDYIPDKSSLQLPIVSPFVDLISNLILKRKKDSFDNINNNYKAKALVKALTKYVEEQIEPDKGELINNLRIIKDKSENDGPQQVKLFKILRKYAIKKIFIYKKEIYRIKLIFYLINLTQFNAELAKCRWIRHLLRKWRFVSFVRKMTREKMELMYKNLHVSYLEMVNSIFSNEEKNNPGVAKEFERFGNGIGMFINEDPYNNSMFDGQSCLGVKKQYLFPNIKLSYEKIGEIEKKIEGKEIVYGEKYISDKEMKDLKNKEDDKIEDENEDEEREEEEDDEKEENNNN